MSCKDLENFQHNLQLHFSADIVIVEPRLKRDQNEILNIGFINIITSTNTVLLRYLTNTENMQKKKKFISHI